MKELIEKFPDHLVDAVRIGRAYSHAPNTRRILNVVIVGMGGSGIGGQIVSDIFRDSSSIPILVVKNSTLPNYVGTNTLVIVSSYSGNTKETLEAFYDAEKRNATIVCITSGGRLKELAGERNLDCLIIPEGGPPRAFLGYSIPLIISVLASFEIVQSRADSIESFARFCRQIDIKDFAKNLAAKISGKNIVIYSHSGIEGVAVRLRQQINENSKLLVSHACIPEMNHNELAAWFTPVFPPTVLMLHGPLGIDDTRAILEKRTKVYSVRPYGSDGFEHILFHIHFGDWLSYFIAEDLGADPLRIDMIEELKARQNS